MLGRREAELLREVVGEGDLLGAYLHGSAVLGGLRPDSDIDVLGVVRRSLTERQRRALLRELLPLSGQGGYRYVELTVVVQDDVRPWRYPPVCDFLYGDWLRGDFERGVLPAREVSPDLAPLLTMVLQGDAPLLGPPPAALLDPVPHADLLRGITAGIPELLADLDHDTRNVLLTLARIWTTLSTGEVRAKDEAAGWALERLPTERRAVLARAREAYLGGTGELGEGARGCAEAMVEAIERLRTA
ncbi:aminoglycoside adenylyltransferase family protein [Streptomyces roseirectus]|uniref:aminoglycoside adenylyltransferase family protein n=1 Tax=Streptomyces roseirectus TaxID=2768066 RepID=UPI001CA78943|nr:aminoglycoside adenylyltransferase family protein [Streptomyces roseirectus]